MRSTKFPNYTLTKIAAYHKALGDIVEMFIPDDPHDQGKMAFFKVEGQYPPKRDVGILVSL